MEPISTEHGGVFMYLMCVFVYGGQVSAMHGDKENHYW